MRPAATPAARWEGHAPAWWQDQWRLPELAIYDVISSTSDYARSRAAAGAPAGTLVIAEQQTAGRGRLGRRWHAPAGTALLLSFLLRPEDGVASATAGAIPLRIGIAVADAIAAASGVECGVKWPNDLVVAGHGKVAGILCEAVTAGDAGMYIVAGIGINVRQQEGDWPAELRGSAASLSACADRPVERAPLAAAVVDAVRPFFEAPLTLLSAQELASFTRRDALRGRAVLIDDRTTSIARGIDPDGALVVEGVTGRQRVMAGIQEVTAPVSDVPSR
ncbi:hypothetical protein BH23GEM9_BH23GEM9_13440 [soil metagenome]